MANHVNRNQVLPYVNDPAVDRGVEEDIINSSDNKKQHNSRGGSIKIDSNLLKRKQSSLLTSGKKGNMIADDKLFAADPSKSDHYVVSDSGVNQTHGDKTDVHMDVKCGCCGWKPECLQKFNIPVVLLVLLCVGAFGQGFVVNGINNVNTATIERRFRLTSAQVATVSSSYDFSAAIAGLFISFFSSGLYKSRWLAMAAVSLALGSLTMSLPHFTTGLYDSGESYTDTCSATENPEFCGEEQLQNYLYLLCFGMILHGIGGATLYTTGVAFLDDSVTTVNSPLFIGIFYAFSTLGPGLGYIVGGQLLDIYVDVDKVDTKSVTLSPEDPTWVGAWWIGFLVNFSLSILLAVPLLAFGAELPTAKHVRETRISQTHKVDGSEKIVHDPTKRRSISEFPFAVLNLLRTPPYTFIVLAACSEGMITSGVATFLPKFIQNQFGITASLSALLAGIAVVPGAAGGQIVGGLICKKMQLKVTGMLRFSIGTCIVFLCASGVMWATCEQRAIAGVNTGYQGSLLSGSLISTCNNNCYCSTEFYEPVCDLNNNVQYFSACHAGCVTESADGKSYSNCSCISAPSGSNVSSVQTGRCHSDCNLIFVFIPLLVLLIFLTFLPAVPSDSSTLRCIEESQRTFSMGLKWLVLRLLGTVPGPVVFGALTDSTCIIWAEKCGRQSSCWIYDNSYMGRNYFLIIAGLKVVSLIFFVLANLTYKAPSTELEIEIDGEHVTKTNKTKMPSTGINEKDTEMEKAYINDAFENTEVENCVNDNLPSTTRKETNL